MESSRLGGMSRDQVPAWLCGAAVTLFLIYAANFLYFFVDDEAIPYVYAQNLLHGLGLAYNAIEGRVEGYSDFLHVGLATLILTTVKTAHLSKVAVFFIGKALSLVAGAGIIVTLTALLRESRCGRAGALTALAFAALAGPLALWSSSSLETVPFTLGCLVLLWALLTGRDTVAAVIGALLLLDRIDGFVYVTTLLASVMLVVDAPRRRAIAKTIIVPLVGLFGVYHAWRWWYFGDLLPAPVESKILYKLLPSHHAVVKAAAEPYWRHIVEVYGWPALAFTLAAAVETFRMGGAARAVAVATTVTILYGALVGDWMFGLRFFVPGLPLAALMFGLWVGRLDRRRPNVAPLAAVLAIAWSGFAAGKFLHVYREAEGMDSFLSDPSTDPHRFFRQYYGLYETVRGRIGRDDVIAYNQAGFLPFMLDVANIDDLGICSRFFARLPTTDVFFTEVGRYQPLTNRHALRAGEAYLLYRDVRYLLARTDLLRHANDNNIPEYLLDGHFRLLGTDPTSDNAIYERTGRPVERFRTTPSLFMENLAHVSKIESASINGAAVDRHDLTTRLPFFRDGRGSIDFTEGLAVHVTFAARDSEVSALVAEDVHVSEPSTLTVTLWSARNRPVYQARMQLSAGEAHPIQIGLPAGTTASQLVIEVVSTPGVKGTVRFTEWRVQGQSAELAAYLARTLKFQTAGSH